MRTVTRVAAGALVLAAFATAGQAQEGAEIGIRGRVTSAHGDGVQNVLVKLTAEGRVLQARTDEQGNYRITGATAGRYAVSMRRIGFEADSTVVQLTDGMQVLSRRLQPLVARVGTMRITEEWAGVHGVIGDRDYQPVEGAVVEVVGIDDEVEATSEGQFALPHRAGASLLLRVRAPGFDPRLVSARIPAEGSVELSVLLDRESDAAPNTVLADELDRRMSWSSPMTLRLTRDEVLGTNAQDLNIAVNLTEAAQRVGVRVAGTACVFVDGVARPGVPIGALRPESVEFIEVYTGGAERTGQLARRWPPRGECGVSTAPTTMRRVTSQNSPQQFVVVWTRKGD